MVYETTVHEGLGVRRITLHNLGLVTAGVLLGVMLMQVQDGPREGKLSDALQAGPIAGENWHGNVRRSTP